MLALSAAGFIATSTSGASPGVMMSKFAKCTWNELTPGRVPAGARISAGKFGRVDRSLPNSAVSLVNRLPVSCMPSPESPARRMTTRSRATTLLVRPPGPPPPAPFDVGVVSPDRTSVVAVSVDLLVPVMWSTSTGEVTCAGPPVGGGPAPSMRVTSNE